MSINSRSKTASFGASRRPRPASLAASDSVRRQLAAMAAARSLPAESTIEDVYHAALGVAILLTRLHSRARAPTVTAVPPSGLPAASGSSSSASSSARKALALTMPSMIKSHLSALKETESKLPSSFGKHLENRMTKILIGEDPSPAYQDPLLKRTFGGFLNQLRDAHFLQSISKGGRIEEFLLIFISKGTAALRAGVIDPSIDPDVLLDRHCALFLRLVASILREDGWSEKSPLLSRLRTMEQQLYQHDPHIADTPSQQAQPVQAVQLELRSMPLAQTLMSLLGLDPARVQGDIATRSSAWTATAAMRDLKRYQTLLNLGLRPAGSSIPLCSDDFDSMVSYEGWRRSEVGAVNSLIVMIVNHQPDLARSSALAANSSTNSATGPGGRPISMVGHRSSSNLSRKPDSGPAGAENQPGSGSIGPDGLPEDLDGPFGILPASPYSLYRLLVMHALMAEIRRRDRGEQGADASTGFSLPKPVTDLLIQLGTWWRVAPASRPVLLLDAARELFQDGMLSADLLDDVFAYLQPDSCPLLERKKPTAGATTGPDGHMLSKRMSGLNIGSAASQSALEDGDPRVMWTSADSKMWGHSLETIHGSLLRDLFHLVMQIYGPEPPNLAVPIAVLEQHIYSDPACPIQPEALDQFAVDVETGLRESAKESYERLKQRQKIWSIDPANITLAMLLTVGANVVTGLSVIASRMSQFPRQAVLGARPVRVLAAEYLPSYVADFTDLLERVIEADRQKPEDGQFPAEEAFLFYREFGNTRMKLRRLSDGTDVVIPVEKPLRRIVERWIAVAQKSVPGWIDTAVASDDFVLPALDDNVERTDNFRHSSSSTDLFRIVQEVVGQVTDLRWCDKGMEAEFMTMVGRIVCEGVVQYCGLVERLFGRELNAEEEPKPVTAASQWERYSQMARDALSTNKVEPYNFREQTLVRLNNIEYVLHELDRREKVFEVDTITATLARNRPKPKKRASERFVFTVKIVEAEDLKACDMNGLSDPYVVLGDEFQKRLAKTRVVYNSLNPRWDESVDIVTTGPINVVATVWDWDALGDHDCVGRASLRLDPTLFRDYLPREFWLPLDSQGRLLIRVSMEGERDDIDYFFGKAFRTLKRTERDMTRHISDKLGPYIRHVLSARTLRSLVSRPGSLSSRFNSLFKGASAFTLSSATTGSITPASPVITTTDEIAGALKPLLDYLNANFALMAGTLTQQSMLAVMARIWKDVLVTIEALLVPPLSDEPSSQTSLSQPEVDVLYAWLDLLFTFFHAMDESTGIADGVPVEILKSGKYHDLKNLAFFYFQPTDDLIAESDRIASTAASRVQARRAQTMPILGTATTITASGGPPQPPAASGGSMFTGVSLRRHKTVLLSRNLGTIRRVKEQKRKESQAEPSDDVILRILRMRPDARRYLKERARQKERLAAVKAAEMIVLRSIAGQGVSSVK